MLRHGGHSCAAGSLDECQFWSSVTLSQEKSQSGKIEPQVGCEFLEGQPVCLGHFESRPE